jgi:uncharacterized protein YdeI (YjbR/CyaY-like superfamily)
MAAVESNSVNNGKTKEFFATLSKSSRNLIMYGLESAKKEDIRIKRFDKLLGKAVVIYY